MEENNNEQKNSKKNKTTEKDFKALLISGAILLFAIIVMMLSPNNEKERYIPQKSDYKNYSDIIKEKNLNLFNEVSTLYDNLVTKTRDYGFYFSKPVSIETIDAEDFLHFIVQNYVVEKNLKYNNNLECLTNEEKANDEECKSFNKIFITKSILDKYINKMFNTDRNFILPNEDNIKYITKSIPINGLNQAYTYDFEDEKYYIGYDNKYNDNRYIYTKFIKQETDENGNLIIYNKAIVCSLSNVNDIYCLKHIDDVKKDENIVFEYKDSEDLNSIQELEFKYIENERFNALNTNYVFDKYDLETFKHTFKKIDNKYYWYSTEIINN